MTRFVKCQLGLTLALSITAAGNAQAPTFDPREWKGSLAGAPTQVLTLGSTHLSQLSTKVDDALLASLLAKLAAYRPDFITAEGVSGEQCDHLERYAAVYPGSYDAWCPEPDAAHKALGIDVPTAAGQVEKTLANWSKSPTPAARRHLAALFLAAGERPSARVQWLRLPAEERHAGDGLTPELVKIVARDGAKPNETFDVAAALAARLGLERVYLVDDHTSDGAVPDAGQAFTDAINAAWKVAPSKAIPIEQGMEANLKSSTDLLELYRFLNQPQTLRQNIRADMGEALREPSAAEYGRQYVADWEVRNLRMVANVVAVFAAHPGARVLNIVGASHKPYYDAYLNVMHDVKVVDVEDVLK